MAESLIIVISNCVMVDDAESECTSGCLYCIEEFKPLKYTVHWTDILPSRGLPV